MPNYIKKVSSGNLITFTENTANNDSHVNFKEVTPMPTDTLPKIAAAYIRVFTDDQVEYSLGQK